MVKIAGIFIFVALVYTCSFVTAELDKRTVSTEHMVTIFNRLKRSTLQNLMQERREKAELLKLKRQETTEILQAKKEERERIRMEKLKQRALLLEQKLEEIKAAIAASNNKKLSEKHGKGRVNNINHQVTKSDMAALPEKSPTETAIDTGLDRAVENVHSADNQGSLISKLQSTKIGDISSRSGAGTKVLDPSIFSELHEPLTFKVDKFIDVLIGLNGTSLIKPSNSKERRNSMTDNLAPVDVNKHVGAVIASDKQEHTTAADPKIVQGSYLNNILGRIWHQMKDIRP